MCGASGGDESMRNSRYTRNLAFENLEDYFEDAKIVISLLDDIVK